MNTRKHIHQESFAVSPERMFEIFITPSSIRGWWGASSAMVMPEKDGIWAATWGDEDDPDYITTAVITEFEPPKRLVLKYGKYFAKSGGLPFEMESSTEFLVEPSESGCVLRVTQDGFPNDSVADDFYAACEIGWTNTFGGIRGYLSESDSE